MHLDRTSTSSTVNRVTFAAIQERGLANVGPVKPDGHVRVSTYAEESGSWVALRLCTEGNSTITVTNCAPVIEAYIVMVPEFGRSMLDDKLRYRLLVNFEYHITVVYFEQPVGVGFSYSENPADYGMLNDTISAADNYAWIQAFLAEMPQYTTQPMWLVGESYVSKK